MINENSKLKTTVNIFMENGCLEIENIECNIRKGKRNYENVIMLFVKF